MRRTILLADDSPTIHRLVTNTFADADFEIVSVSNGEAAVRKFEEIHPHVVLADIYMPGKTGYEVCTYIRQHPAVSSTPVILLVGAFDVFDEAKAQEIGANGHITKPFEPQALFSLVESVLPPEEVGQDETAAVVADQPGVETQTETKTELVELDHQAAEVIPEVIMEVPVVNGEQPEKSAQPEDEDLLGLESLFPEPAPEPLNTASTVSDVEIDRIADRVAQRLSSQVIESIAWELVPDIAERIVREELKRTHES